MVAADLDDASSLQSAFKGATAIFAVTDFWQPFMAIAMDPARQAKELKPGQTVNEWAYNHELNQAKAVIDAAAKVQGLQRFVWSSLPSVKKLSGGKYTWVYHFDSKADAAEYLEQQHPDLWEKTSLVLVGFYTTNHILFPIMRPTKVSEGVYEIAMNVDDQQKAPYLDAGNDVGPHVYPMITSLPPLKEKMISAQREMLSIGEFLQIFGKVNGVKASVRRTSFEENVKIDREMAETMEFFNELGLFGGDPNVVTAEDLGLDLKLGTVSDWMEKQDWSSVL